MITGAASGTGTYSASIEVTDSSIPTLNAVDDISIAVSEPAPLSVMTTTLDDANLNTQYAEPIAVSGGTAPYAFSVSAGSLPLGLTLDPASGIIQGTPLATGLSSFTVTVTDSAESTDQTSASFTLNTDAEPGVSVPPATLSAAQQGDFYSQLVTATGGEAPYTWSVTAGALPAGVTLTPLPVTSMGLQPAVATSRLQCRPPTPETQWHRRRRRRSNSP